MVWKNITWKKIREWCMLRNLFSTFNSFFTLTLAYTKKYILRWMWLKIEVKYLSIPLILMTQKWPILLKNGRFRGIGHFKIATFSRLSGSSNFLFLYPNLLQKNKEKGNKKKWEGIFHVSSTIYLALIPRRKVGWKFRLDYTIYLVRTWDSKPQYKY